MFDEKYWIFIKLIVRYGIMCLFVMILGVGYVRMILYFGVVWLEFKLIFEFEGMVNEMFFLNKFVILCMFLNFVCLEYNVWIVGSSFLDVVWIVFFCNFLDFIIVYFLFCGM